MQTFEASDKNAIDRLNLWLHELYIGVSKAS